MDDKVFIYLRLRIGDRILSRSKIREFAGLGSLLADFLRSTMSGGIEIPDELDPVDRVPVLDYVDANTENVLISFRVDPVQKVQIVEGRIPPAYQDRMLDPEATTFSLGRFTDRAAEGLSEERRRELSERLARSQLDLLGRIKSTMDEEGNFLVQVRLGE